MADKRKGFRLERRLNYGQAHEDASRGALDRNTIEPDWSSISPQVRDSNALGYDVLLSAEIPLDPYLPLVIASQVPGELTLGTGVAVAFSRSPVSTAYSAWELQRMSGGRFMLGLGSQVKAHIERRFSMPWSAPATRMKEYIQLVKACWTTWQTGEPLNFEGENYKVDLMPPGMMPAPQQHPEIPVQLAAVGDAMLRVAGQHCEGVRLHDFCSRAYVEQVALPNLRIGFERSGRPEAAWSAFEITGGGMIATGANSDELARETLDLRKRLAFYASTPAYRVQLELEGFGDQAEELTRLSKQGRWSDMLSVFTEEMAHRYAAIGTHDVIVARIRDHFAHNSAVNFAMPLRSEQDRGVLRELITDLKSSR